jgi:drug/metabolite transporter (DMT)-like permease
MQIYWVFISVVLIWSTTPLAIVFSTQGSNASFGVGLRMLIGLLICLLLLYFKKQKLTLTKTAVNHYVFAGLGVFFTMNLVYYGAQNLSSGLISVVFGLTPIVTGLFAWALLKEPFFRFYKILGSLLGLSGLMLVFNPALILSWQLKFHLLSVVLGMTFQAFISVKLKQINVKVSALESTTGALLISVPLFVIVGLLNAPDISQINAKAIYSIFYLAVFGSVIGFMAYYYLISHASVQTVGVIPLITPVFALLLGAYFNQESLTTEQLWGVILVIVGLAIYQFNKK